MTTSMSRTSHDLGSFRLFDNPRATLDSSIAYLTMAQALAADSALVVDVGCGRGAQIDSADRGRPLHDVRGPGRTVLGIDVDPDGGQNPLIDEFRMIGPDGRWPVADGAADLVMADWVLEHVDDPVAFVAEVDRILRPGGAFVARTVSRHSPFATAVRSIPNAAHARVVSHLQPQRAEKDVFPTRYRMNDRARLAALFDAGFDWTCQHRPGLDQYLVPWPRAARAVASVESRLPRYGQLVLIVAARKKVGPR